MERDDGSSERSTTDEFLEAASSEAVYQDIELLYWLLPQATRIVRSKLAGTVDSGEIEDIAARAVEKFYLTFDFAGLADLPIEHARNRLFGFLNRITLQTVIDYQRALQRRRQQQEKVPLPLIAISEDQLPAAKAAVRKMPKSEKEFLQLKLVENLSYPEMQALYATPRKKPPSISGMKSRMARILGRLRKQL